MSTQRRALTPAQIKKTAIADLRQAAARIEGGKVYDLCSAATSYVRPDRAEAAAFIRERGNVTLPTEIRATMLCLAADLIESGEVS